MVVVGCALELKFAIVLLDKLLVLFLKIERNHDYLVRSLPMTFADILAEASGFRGLLSEQEFQLLWGITLYILTCSDIQHYLTPYEPHDMVHNFRGQI